MIPRMSTLLHHLLRLPPSPRTNTSARFNENPRSSPDSPCGAINSLCNTTIIEVNGGRSSRATATWPTSSRATTPEGTTGNLITTTRTSSRRLPAERRLRRGRSTSSRRCLTLLSSTRPPGGMTRGIRRWVDVLSSRYATTGRNGSDLLRDDEGHAPQRRATGDPKEYYRSRTQRAEPRGPRRLTRYAIGTTGYSPAAPRGFFTRPILGRAPGQGHPALDPPGNATLRGEQA